MFAERELRHDLGLRCTAGPAAATDSLAPRPHCHAHAQSARCRHPGQDAVSFADTTS